MTAKEHYGPQQTLKRVIRQDPCAYCKGEGGTIDHIEPKAGRLPGNSKRHPRRCGQRRGHKRVVKGPENWTGSCAQCNHEKNRTSLLHFLLLHYVA